jgi:hypothetical protein
LNGAEPRYLGVFVVVNFGFGGDTAAAVLAEMRQFHETVLPRHDLCYEVPLF